MLRNNLHLKNINNNIDINIKYRPLGTRYTHMQFSGMGVTRS